MCLYNNLHAVILGVGRNLKGIVLDDDVRNEYMQDLLAKFFELHQRTIPQLLPNISAVVTQRLMFQKFYWAL